MHFTTWESLGEVGGPRLGSPGHPHQVVGVLHGLGGSLQVPLYGPTSDGPIAGRVASAALHVVLAGSCGALDAAGAPDNRCLGERDSGHNRSRAVRAWRGLGIVRLPRR